MPRLTASKWAKEQFIGAILDQLDVLVAAFCDHCCLTNYYNGQRQEIIQQLNMARLKHLFGATRFEIEHDISGSDYAEDDSDVPYVGDTVVIRFYHEDKELFQWDGHLKRGLRGTPAPMPKK